MADPARMRHMIGPRARAERTEQLPPSEYTRKENQKKADRQKILDDEAKARHQKLDGIAEATFQLRKLNAEVAMAATAWKLKEAELAAKQGVKLLAELAELPSTDVTAENRQKFIGLKLKYPMAWKNVAAEKEMESWDRINAEAVKRAADARTELATNRTALAELEKWAKDRNLKAKSISLDAKGGLDPTFEEPKPAAKLTEAAIGRLHGEFDTQLANYESDRTALNDELSSDKPDANNVKKYRARITQANALIQSVGKRLVDAAPDMAPDIQEQTTAHSKRATLDEHGELETRLKSMDGKPHESKKPLIQELNEVKRRLPGYDLIDVETGNLAKGTAAPVPSPAQPTVTAPVTSLDAVPPLKRATPTPVPVAQPSTAAFTPPASAAPTPTPTIVPVAAPVTPITPIIAGLPPVKKLPIYAENPGALRVEDVPDAPEVKTRAEFEALPEGTAARFGNKIIWKPVKAAPVTASASDGY